MLTRSAKWTDATQAVQFTPVVASGEEGSVSAVTAANSVFLGVVQNDPKENETATVAFVGVTKVVYKGTISAEAQLAMASGGVVAATTPTAVQIVGIALVAGSSGHIGEMMIMAEKPV
jgi:hypothetical protein